MYKKLATYFTIFLIFLFSLTIGDQIIHACNLYSNETDTVNLVLDSLNYNALPHKFRKTSDLTNLKDANLNLKGLDKLNISGSEQFSEYNLPLLINKIGTSSPITVIDLRQESHGFINGLPVSWSNSKNNANMGLTRTEVLMNEANKLAGIKLNTPISFYNHPGKTIVPAKVQSENQLVTSKQLSYVRIPVTDGKIPTNDMVDYFIDFVNSQPQNSWLHFHCKKGIGRTTTFMIMYDMIKNYNQATFDDIIKRQLLLANFNEERINSFKNPERIKFLETFYKYCKENGPNFKIKWSIWNRHYVL
ncbi:MAG: protein-tyrosine phosphatase family protein [Bacillota bacterium]|nr:protein-tyrosine phosphatase family protein [Bacillota bacterium]